MSLRPFLMKTPAQTPQMVPKESWYTLTMLLGSEGVVGLAGSFWGLTTMGEEEEGEA